MWWDIAPEMRAEWEDWHYDMPERSRHPGISRLALDLGRFVFRALRGRRHGHPHRRRLPRSAERAHALVAQAHAAPSQHGAQPSPRREPRSRPRRMDGDAAPRAWPAGAGASPLPQQQGLVGAFLEAQSMAGAPPTTEQKIRGGDVEARRSPSSRATTSRRSRALPMLGRRRARRLPCSYTL